MRRIMMKSKIHRATVTEASVDYEGSITIDRSLMEAADMLPFEQVHVFDISNGARLVTYAIPGGEGEVCVNGAAARKVEVGDIIIVLSFGGFVPREWKDFEPRIVKVDEKNRITGVTGPKQLDEGDDESSPHKTAKPGQQAGTQ